MAQTTCLASYLAQLSPTLTFPYIENITNAQKFHVTLLKVCVRAQSFLPYTMIQIV